MSSTLRLATFALGFGALALVGCPNLPLTTSTACPTATVVGTTCGPNNPRPIRCVCITSANTNPDASVGTAADPCPSINAVAPARCTTASNNMQAWACPNGTAYTTMPDPCPQGSYGGTTPMDAGGGG